jgi:hypothetical protein
MPADNIVLIRVGFFFDAIVNNENAIGRLDRSNVRLDDVP